MGTAQASDFLENMIVDWIFRTRTPAKPTALYLALFTAAPSDAAGGTEVPTVNTNYARVNLAPLDTNWLATQGGTSGNSSGTGGQTSNAVAITYGAPTVVGSGGVNWGTVTHYAIFDAITGGNLLIWDALTASRTILAGDPAPAFAIGQLQISVT
jgi:hypothetical protein